MISFFSGQIDLYVIFNDKNRNSCSNVRLCLHQVWTRLSATQQVGFRLIGFSNFFSRSPFPV